MLFRSNDTATTEIYTSVNTLSLYDALPISEELGAGSSTISFTRQLGGAFGVNMVALAIEHGDHQNGMPTVEAFQFAWWMVAVFLALAIVPVWKMRT